AELAGRRPGRARSPQAPAARVHRPGSRRRRARGPGGADPRSAARRPRRRRSVRGRRRSGRSGDLRARPTACVCSSARAVERVLRVECPGARSIPPACRRPAFDRGGTADRVGAHLLSTHPDGNSETVSTLREAARGAGNRGAPDVALTYLQRALAEPPHANLEPILGYELGTAALSAGELDLAIEKLRQATRELSDEQLRAEAASALGSALFLADQPEEAMTDLTTVIDALPESEREQGLRLQATRWAAVRGGSVAVWRRLQESGERFVVASPTPRTIGERLQVAAAAYEAARTGTADQARTLALQALADGRLLDDPGPESGAFWIAPSVLFFAYADDDVARVSTEVIEWAKQHGSMPAFSMA